VAGDLPSIPMTPLLIVLASVIAVAAAIRSTWSPCGLSMLSTITPIAERGRSNRYASTAAWFILGAVLGGATLAVGAALLAAAVAALELSDHVAVGAVAALAALTMASDLQLGGLRLPSHTRQVNETWLDQFRSWVYGGGFGWQIGVGLATYVTTSAVYLMLAVAALTASPLAAFAIVTGFGLVRGLAVLLGRGLTTPARLMALHRRLDELLPTAQRAVVLVQAAVLGVAAAAAWGRVAGGVLGLAAVAAAVGRRPRPATRPARVASPA
jgi:MFS family permease